MPTLRYLPTRIDVLPPLALASSLLDRKTIKAIAAAILIGTGAVGGLAYLGTYGHLKDKGWGSWKAGAASGAIGGALSAVLLIAGSVATGQEMLPMSAPKTSTAGLGAVPWNSLARTVNPVYYGG